MIAQSDRKQNAVSWLLILAVWLLFFWPALSGSQQFGFRDTGSMYYPMLQWIDQQWQSGDWPLWNPLDDFGVSVVGDTSSSLFYPGKLVFLVRYFSFDVRFAWYVSLHVLLAAVGARLAARSVGCRPLASSLVAISYAFGGTVFFQTCNVVFLVGAAWLPFVFAAVWWYSLTERNELRWLVLASIALAMMVLGGDPQMAFMAGLTSIPILWTTAGKRNSRQKCTAPLLIAVAGIALSAVQVLPSLNWLSTSERSANSSSPNTIWSAMSQQDFFGLISEPQAGSHAAAVYEFSFAPWRIVEAVWPNVLGKLDFVSETVWANQLAGADRLWTPSIYFGVVVLLLAMERMHWFRRGDASRKIDRQLTWIMTVFLVGSFGWYGPGWFVNELQLMRGGFGFGDTIGKPVGGLYWWLVTFLPGFGSFRYPAKLLTLAALAACILGGRGFDSLVSETENSAGKRMILRAVGLGGVSGGVAILIVLIGNRQIGLSPHAAIEVLNALIHSTVVLGICCFLAHFRRSFPERFRRWPIFLLCVFDLFVANHGLTGFVPSGKMAVVQKGETATLYRNPDLDRNIFDGNKTVSLEDVTRFDRLTSRPRLHWLSKQRVAGSFSSIEPLDVLTWKQIVDRLDSAHRRIILESSGVEQSIDSIEWQTGSSDEIDAFVHRSSMDGLARFRLVSSWSVLPEVEEYNLAAVRQRTTVVLQLQIVRGPDWVVIESDHSPPFPAAFTPVKSPGRVTIISQENTKIVLDIDTEQACMLLATDYFDRNWTATVSNNDSGDQPVTILRGNRLMRAVPVSAGQSRVTFQYRAPGLRTGIAISAAAWMLAILLLVRRNTTSMELNPSGLPATRENAKPV